MQTNNPTNSFASNSILHNYNSNLTKQLAAGYDKLKKLFGKYNKMPKTNAYITWMTFFVQLPQPRTQIPKLILGLQIVENN